VRCAERWNPSVNIKYAASISLSSEILSNWSGILHGGKPSAWASTALTTRVFARELSRQSLRIICPWVSSRLSIYNIMNKIRWVAKAALICHYATAPQSDRATAGASMDFRMHLNRTCSSPKRGVSQLSAVVPCPLCAPLPVCSFGFWPQIGNMHEPYQNRVPARQCKCDLSVVNEDNFALFWRMAHTPRPLRPTGVTRALVCFSTGCMVN
jgi:hypothetical protein